MTHAHSDAFRVHQESYAPSRIELYIRLDNEWAMDVNDSMLDIFDAKSEFPSPNRASLYILPQIQNQVILSPLLVSRVHTPPRDTMTISRDILTTKSSIAAGIGD